MVAIFTGLGAGFERGSGAMLGGAGVLGGGSLGRAGEKVSLNAATGNLLISQQDEFLVGKGPDIAIGRTYNSVGALDENGDNWRQSTDRRVFGQNGTIGTDNSSIRRVAADGSIHVFVWNGEQYERTDDPNAHDTMRYANSEWTWTDGATHTKEIYEADGANNWRLKSVQDLDGNALTYAYNTSGKLSTITTENGETTTYSWSGDNIISVTTGYTDYNDNNTAKTLVRTRYYYDSQDRLERVRTDLTPGDSNVSDGEYYDVTYTYDGTSNRIASISQTDGSKLEIDYDSAGRVVELKQVMATSAEDRITSINYEDGYTEIVNPTGHMTTLHFDGANRLTKIVSPPPQSGGLPQTTEFSYSEPDYALLHHLDGDNSQYLINAYGSDPLPTVTHEDMDGSKVVAVRQSYGSMMSGALWGAGLQLNTGDLSNGGMDVRPGDVVHFTADVKSLVSGVTIFAQFAAYDSNGNLTGEAVQQVTSTNWQRISGSWEVNDDTDYVRFGLFSYRNETVQTGNFDFAARGIQVGRTEKESLQSKITTRDGLGNITTKYIDGDGNVARILDANGDSVEMHYDSDNRLVRKTIVAAHTASAGEELYERYAYDEEGHLRYHISADGHVREYRYEADGQLDEIRAYMADTYTIGRTHITEAKMDAWVSGTADQSAVKVETFDYDARGQNATERERFGSTNSSGATQTGEGYQTTAYTYDQNGKLLSSQRNGELAKVFAYDGMGRLISSGRKINSSTTETLTTITFDDANLKTVVENAVNYQKTSTFNKAGELISETETGSLTSAGGTATQYYDKAGRTRYTVDQAGRKHYFLHDFAGRKIADISHDGEMVMYRYDAAGRLTSTTKFTYTVDMTNARSRLEDVNDSVELSAIRPAAHGADIWDWISYDAAGRVTHTIDGEGGVTEYTYDSAGRLTDTRQYANEVSSSALADLKADPAFAPLPMPLSQINGTASGETINGTSAGEIIRAGDGIDTIVAGDGDDWIDLGAVGSTNFQYAYGQGGDDVYVYAREQGKVFISSTAETSTSGTNDVVYFRDLTLSDITITTFDYGSGNSNGLALSLQWAKNGQSGELRIANGGQEIEKFVFADGSSVTSFTADFHIVNYPTRTDDLIYDSSGDGFVVGSNESDAIYGGDGDDYIRPGAANGTWWQYVYGQAGNDTYEISRNSGRVFISSSGEAANGGTDTIYFNDLTLADITATIYDYGSGNSNGRSLSLKWDHNGQTNEMRIANGGQEIEKFIFADGSTASSIEANFLIQSDPNRNNDKITGTSGNDLLVGTLESDFIYGGDGDDYIRMSAHADGWWQYAYGQNGNDTYEIGMEDHDVYIGSAAESANTGTGDTIYFRDLNLSDLTVSLVDYTNNDPNHPEGQKLNLHWDKNGFTGNVRIANGGDHIEKYIFADGSSVAKIEADFNVNNNANQIDERLTGTSGDDFIVGSAQSDHIMGGAGNDYLSAAGAYSGWFQYFYGQAGDDVYEFTRDNGMVFIGHSMEPTGGGNDTVYFKDLLFSDLTVGTYDYGSGHPDGLSLSLTWTHNGVYSEVRIANSAQEIEKFVFADGTWLSSIVVGGTNTLNAASSANTMVVERTHAPAFSVGRMPGPAPVEDVSAWLPGTSSNDRITRTFYDRDGRVKGTLNAEGFLSEIEYDAAGQKVRETIYSDETSSSIRETGTFDALLATVTANANADVTSRWVYDGQGFLRYAIDPIGRVRELIYHDGTNTDQANGQIRQTIAYATALGSVSDYEYATVKAALATHADDRATYHVYDDRGRRTYSIDEAGAVTHFEYNSRDLVTKTTKFSATRTTTSQPSDATMDSWAGSNATGARIVENFYNDSDALSYQIDAEGYVTGFVYDGSGRLTAEYRYANIPSGANVASAAALHTWAGTQTGTSDKVSKTFTYDNVGRLKYTYDGEGTRHYSGYFANGTQAYDIAAYGQGDDEARSQFGYDASGQLRYHYRFTGVTTGIHAVAEYSYDAFGNRLTAKDALGNTTSFQYDKLGRVTKQTDAASGETDFVYDAFGRAVKSTDALNRDSYTWYDQLGRVIAQLDAENYLTETTYNAFGEVASVTRRSEKFVGTPSLTTPATVTANTLDAVTTYEYDDRGQLTKMTDPNGAFETYAYNAFGQMTSSTDKAGETTEFTYNERGLIETRTRQVGTTATSATVTDTYAYDARGNRVAMVEADGKTEERVTTYQYDDANRLISTNDGAVTVGGVTYTPSTIDVFDPATGTTSTGVTPREFLEYDRRGNVISRVDAAGNKTYFWYDKQNRLTTEQRQLGSAGTQGVVTEHDYDNAGNVTETRTYDAVQTMAAARSSAAEPAVNQGVHSHRQTNFTYDNLNRLTETKVSSVTTGSWSGSSVVTGSTDIVTKTEYDALGRVTKTIDANSNETIYDYSVASQVTVTDALSGTTVTKYDSLGNAIQVTDARGFDTHNYYDDAGQMVASLQEYESGKYYLTATTYTARGNVATITRYHNAFEAAPSSLDLDNLPTGFADAAKDATTEFTYDDAGRLIQTEDAEGATETFVYDGLDRQTSRTSKLGSTSVFAYNALDRVTSETQTITYTVPNPDEVSTIVTTFAYDINGNRTQMVEASGETYARTTKYHYDELNRLVKTERPDVSAAYSTTGAAVTATPVENIIYNVFGEVQVRESYGLEGSTAHQIAKSLYWYDDLGRVSHAVDPAGTLTTYTYDKNGNVLKTETWSTQLTVSSLDPNTAAPTPQGTARTTLAKFDALNRMSEQIIEDIKQGAYEGSNYTVETADLISKYTYDAAGNRTRIEVWNDLQATAAFEATTTSTFDGLGRELTRLDGENFKTAWTYDKDGNVTEERRYATQGASPSTHADDRVTTFEYDRLGQRIKETRAGVLTFNGTSGHAAAKSVDILYEYNALGQVTKKTEGTGEAIDYVYDNGGRLRQEKRTSYLDHTNTSVTPTVEYDYNDLGDLTYVRALGKTSAGNRQSAYTYGAGGQLSTIQDASGFTKTYVHDMHGRVIREEYSRTDADSNTHDEAIATWFDIAGRVTKQGVIKKVSGSWVTTGSDLLEMTYNAYGEVATRGLNGKLMEVFEYDKAGQLIHSTEGDGIRKFYMHDGAGNRTLTIISSGGHSTAAADTSSMSRDTALTAFENGSQVLDIMGVKASGLVATITEYNNRGEAIHVREPERELSGSTTSDLTTSRTYTAFGEVASETDARNNTTDYTYNTMGRLIETKSPQVSVSSESGGVISTANARPTEHMYYDEAGRLEASKDANGNVTKMTLLAGTGYGGTEALQTQIIFADGGTLTTKYDIHGDARKITDQISRVTDQTFDAMGRLTKVENHDGLNEHFAYDGLGQRIKRWLSHDTLSAPGIGSTGTDVEKTIHDLQGRITKHVAIGGDTTQYVYSWDSALATTGLGTFGGWTKTTTLANNQTQVEKTDQFGRELAPTYMGAYASTITYDKSGRVVERSGDHDTTQVWYNTGRLFKQTVDNDTGRPLPISPATQSIVRAKTHYQYQPAPPTSNYDLITTYAYDAAGNLTSETFKEVGELHFEIYLNGDDSWNYTQNYYTITYRSAQATYDAMNRILTWDDAGSSLSESVSTIGMVPTSVDTAMSLISGIRDPNTPDADISWTYDANGNIRRTVSNFKHLDEDGGISSTASSYDYYFRYDSMNRVVTDNGDLNGSSEVVRGSEGRDYTYNAAGQRLSATSNASAETFTYDAGGRIDEVKVGGTLRAAYQYDGVGRVTDQDDYETNGTTIAFSRDVTYNAKGQITTETTNTKTGTTIYKQVATHGYNTDTSGLYALGSIATTSTLHYENGSYQRTSSLKNYFHYDAHGSISPGSVQFDPNTSVANDHTWTNHSYSFINGRSVLVKADINDGSPTDVFFVADMNGQIIRRDEAVGAGSGQQGQMTDRPHEGWYYFGGKQMGHVTNNGAPEAMDYKDSIADRTADSSSGTGHFRHNASTHTAAAQFAPGIAPINSYNQGGGGGAYTVRAGETLQSIAAGVWGDSSLWYKIAESNGLSGAASLAEGQVLRLPAGVMRNTHNASTFKPYNPGEAIGDTSPTVPMPADEKGCGVAGQIILVAIAVVVTSLTQGLTAQLFSTLGRFGAVASGATSAAAGSIVSQGVGVATGIQDKFSWNAVGLAAIGGGIGGAAGKPAGSWQQAAVRGARNSAITQGIGVATGMQDSFSWAGVAAAGVSSAVINGLNRSAASAMNGLSDGQRMGFTATHSMVGALANAATRSVLEGTSFGDNLIAALPDVIGQTIGEAVAGSVQARADTAAAERAETIRAEKINRALTDAQNVLAQQHVFASEGLSEFQIASGGQGAISLAMADRSSAIRGGGSFTIGDEFTFLSSSHFSEVFSADDLPYSIDPDGNVVVQLSTLDGELFGVGQEVFYLRTSVPGVQQGASVSSNADYFELRSNAISIENRSDWISGTFNSFSEQHIYTRDHGWLDSNYCDAAGNCYAPELVSEFAWIDPSAEPIPNYHRIGQLSQSPIGAIGYVSAYAISGDQNVADAALEVGSIVDAGIAARRGRVPVRPVREHQFSLSLQPSQYEPSFGQRIQDRANVFFSPETANIYRESGATLGIRDRAMFIMPAEDGVHVRDTASAMLLTGHAPSMQRAYLEGRPVYGLDIPVFGMDVRLPTRQDAGDYPHFLSGGNTAVRLPGPNSGFMINDTREFVIPGGQPIPRGSVLFRIEPNGERTELRRW